MATTASKEDVLGYVANLRHALRQIESAISSVEGGESMYNPGKRGAESVKEAKQDMRKAAAALRNELNRFPRLNGG